MSQKQLKNEHKNEHKNEQPNAEKAHAAATGILPIAKPRNAEEVWRENNPERFLWRTARDRAKLGKRQFTIRVVDVIIPRLCPYLDMPLNTKKGRGRNNYDVPTLDRINSNFDYTEHNIQVISWKANKMKNDATAEELDVFATNQILKFSSTRTRKELYEKLKLEFGCDYE